MKLLTRMLILTILLLSIAAGLIALQPDHFQVRRSIRIQAAPATIFPLISQSRAWAEWTYWHKADPEMQRQYKGPAQGKDAEWEFQSRTQGNGGVRFTEVYADQAVYYETHLEGLLRHANGSLVLVPEGPQQTTVLWEIHANTGDNWLAKALVPFADRIIGSEFEIGLQKLKEVSEQSAQRAH